MVRYLALYGIALAIFFALDILWLGLIAKNLYREKLGFILSSKVNWAAAVIFYVLYIAGVIYFAVLPGTGAGGIMQALTRGAILGLLCYATYDLTNMATIAEWPLVITIIDIIWGAFITAACAALTALAANKIL